MYNNPYETYKKTEIQTANQGKLIVMLYEGALKFANAAIVAIDEKKYDIANNNITRTEDIVTELLVSLDYDKGGDIAKKLASIYIYINQQLLEANITKTVEPIKVVIGLMSDLKQSWEQIASQTTETDKIDMNHSVDLSG